MKRSGFTEARYRATTEKLEQVNKFLGTYEFQVDKTTKFGEGDEGGGLTGRVKRVQEEKENRALELGKAFEEKQKEKAEKREIAKKIADNEMLGEDKFALIKARLSCGF